MARASHVTREHHEAGASHTIREHQDMRAPHIRPEEDHVSTNGTIEIPALDQTEIVLTRRDLRAAVESLTVEQARWLVDQYYAWQDFRMQAGSQVAALTKTAEPCAAIDYAGGQLRRLEDDVKAMLDRYTRVEPTGMGAWAREVVGIGPVISAGLLANIDITKCPTVGHLWSFAGLNPEAVWAKGQKRPWNARLKVLCFKIGESFVKVQSNKNDIYGKVYVARKLYEVERNTSGVLAGQAAQKLERFKIGKDTDAYKAYSTGLLPPAHIHARARRYAVKAFLADFWSEWYRRHHGQEPPLPYPLAHLGHIHVREGVGWIR